MSKIKEEAIAMATTVGTWLDSLEHIHGADQHQLRLCRERIALGFLDAVDSVESRRIPRGQKDG